MFGLPSEQSSLTPNESAIATLARSLQLSQGTFSLILVRCNYAELRDRVLAELHRRAVPFEQLTLPEPTTRLYTTIHQTLALDTATPSYPPALMVLGLEAITQPERLWAIANQVRDEFRKNLPFPLVLWVTDQVLQTLSREAQDLKGWATTAIRLELPPTVLVPGLEYHINRLFNAILQAGDESFLPNWRLLPPCQPLRSVELEFAIADLRRSGHPIDPELQAGMDFLQGRLAHAQAEFTTAREFYQRSLQFWQQRSREASQQVNRPTAATPAAPLQPLPYVEREACVLVYLGLLWRSYAVLQRSSYQGACATARDYFERSLTRFEQENRQDLVARFMLPLAEVLQKLAAWDDLDLIARRGLVLHKLYRDRIRQARDYGFLAEVALQREAWATAQVQSETALQILATVAAEVAIADPPDPHQEEMLAIAQQYHRPAYQLLLARAAAQLGDPDRAIGQLETAIRDTPPDRDPPLAIQLRRHLQDLYFQQQRYQEAFQMRQQRRSLEYQYGFRAFIGALRLEPQHRDAPLPTVDSQRLLEQEIETSGRQQDVQRLLARLTRKDQKLTVIHGPSGVGKSSIINAGLVPALRDFTVGDARVARAVVIDTYRNWPMVLAQRLAALVQQEQAQWRGESKPDLAAAAVPPGDIAQSVACLRQLTDLNTEPVLIFDQFEEFFIQHDRGPNQRQVFYEFLRDCLQLAFVKVFLVLREDYLHHLLEFQRFALQDSTDAIALDLLQDILGKDIRYPLGDFSPAEAEAVITHLTQQAQFYLEDDLVAALVQDLAGDSGTIRPIELQVVGAQLQTENITTLAAYRARGPKEKLVQRSLADIVANCGPENEAIAWVILYLLTNENETRPPKTRQELEADLIALNLHAEIPKLDLVLDILTGSGLVFLVPETPDDRYQLVHDYLVSFIRQRQGRDIERLQTELIAERQKHPVVEA